MGGGRGPLRQGAGAGAGGAECTVSGPHCQLPAASNARLRLRLRVQARSQEARGFQRPLLCAGRRGAVPTGHCSLYAWLGADPSLTLGHPVLTLAPQVQSHGEPGRDVSVCLGSRADCAPRGLASFPFCLRLPPALPGRGASLCLRRAASGAMIGCAPSARSVSITLSPPLFHFQNENRTPRTLTRYAIPDFALSQSE